MDVFWLVLIALGVGAVGGYTLATHIHTIAANAASTVQSDVNRAAVAVTGAADKLINAAVAAAPPAPPKT